MDKDVHPTVDASACRSRQRTIKAANITGTVFFFLYIAVVLRITVFRSGFGLSHLFQNGSWNLTLFQGYLDLFRKREWFSLIYLFGGNIVWFIPFGMYLQCKCKGRSIGWTVLFGFLFSLSIETLQYIFGTGFSELDDLALNTLGALIGAFLTLGITKIRQKSGKREKSILEE